MTTSSHSHLSPANTPSSKQLTTFHNLPLELRLQIYTYTFTGLQITPHRSLIYLNSGSWSSSHLLSTFPAANLLLASRLVSHEATPIFWRLVTLDLSTQLVHNQAKLRPGPSWRSQFHIANLRVDLEDFSGGHLTFVLQLGVQRGLFRGLARTGFGLRTLKLVFDVGRTPSLCEIERRLADFVLLRRRAGLWDLKDFVLEVGSPWKGVTRAAEDEVFRVAAEQVSGESWLEDGEGIRYEGFAEEPEVVIFRIGRPKTLLK